MVFSSANFINYDNYNLKKLAKYLISLKLKANPLFMLFFAFENFGVLLKTLFFHCLENIVKKNFGVSKLQKHNRGSLSSILTGRAVINGQWGQKFEAAHPLRKGVLLVQTPKKKEITVTNTCM